MPYSKELALIESAFSKLDESKERFLDNERAFKAKYKSGVDGEDKRTAKRKAGDRTRSKLYTPLTKTTINIIHAIFKTSFMGNRCPIEVSHIGKRSDGDLKKQNAIMAALKKEWRQPGHRTGLSKAVLSAISQPLGIVALFWDAHRQEIRTRHIPITDLAFDPFATDIHDVENKSYKWRESVREIKEKIEKNIYNPKKEDKSKLYPDNAMNSMRIEMKDLYERVSWQGKPRWKLSVFCNSVRVQVKYVKRSVFHHGYCLESLPSVDEDLREDELQVYGQSIPELVREIQTEYNIKRNQKIDVTENQIDPLMAVDVDAGQISISDINSRKKYIRVQTIQGKGVRDVIQPLGEPGSYGLSEEIAMLKEEYEVTTGVNSILTGQTGPSDRRAMGALQTVNAASSMRIESMMQTLLDTKLHSYAQSFVELVWQHTPDEVFIQLLEDETIIEVIGTQGKRKPLDFDVKVNFGTTLANEAKLQQLNSLLQILMQSQKATPEIVERIMKQILVLIEGESAPIDEIETQEEEIDEPSLEEKEATAIGRGGV